MFGNVSGWGPETGLKESSVHTPPYSYNWEEKQVEIEEEGVKNLP